jgi:hypothetical protein
MKYGVHSLLAVTHTVTMVDNNYENEHEEDIVDVGYVIDLLLDGRVRIADELTFDYQLTSLSLIFEFDPRTVVKIDVLEF